LDALDVEASLDLLAELRTETETLVSSAGVEPNEISYRMSAMMRYVGQGYEIEAEIDPVTLRTDGAEALAAAFATAYQARYGRVERMPPEILSWRVVGAGPRPALADAIGAGAEEVATPPEPHQTRPAFFVDGFKETPVYRRTSLLAGQSITGPAIIEEDESTLILPPEFRLTVDPALNLIAIRSSET
jgi:N-methylhydantoinase A